MGPFESACSDNQGCTKDPVFFSPAGDYVPPVLPFFTGISRADGMEDEYQYSLGTDEDAEDVLSWDVDP